MAPKVGKKRGREENDTVDDDAQVADSATATSSAPPPPPPSTDESATTAGDVSPVLSLIQSVVEGAKKFKSAIPTVLPSDANEILPKDNSFSFPDDDLVLLQTAMEESGKSAQHLFLRSDIGTGKSTMGNLLKAGSPDKVVHVKLSSGTKARTSVCKAAKCASIDEWTDALSEKMLILDECHLAFSDAALLQKLVKERIPGFFLLMFSSSSAHQAAQADSTIALATPTVITKRCFVNLSFSPAEVKGLVKCSNSDRLFTSPNTSRQTVDVEATLAPIIWSLFLGHRLLTVTALELMNSGAPCEVKQSRTPDALYRTLLLNLREKVLKPSCLNTCRSAIINSNFGKLFHGQLTCFRLLCDGYVEATTSKTFEYDSTGSLITRGALRPTKGNVDIYEWTNSFVARFFHERFAVRYQIKPVVDKQDSVSLVLLALAWFDLQDYTKDTNNREEALQFLQMPYEERFQSTLQSGWNQFPEVCKALPEAWHDGDSNSWKPGIAPNGRLLTPKQGRIDFQLTLADKRMVFVEVAVFGKPVQRAVTETQIRIAASNASTITDHIAPFFTGVKAGKRRSTYPQALQDGHVIVVIFSHSDVMDEAEQQVKAALETYKSRPLSEKLKVIILGMKSVFRYEVITASAVNGAVTSTKTTEELTATLCAKRVEGDQLVVNQRQPTLHEQLLKYGHPVGLDAKPATTPVLDYLQQTVRQNISKVKSSVEDMCLALEMSAWCVQLDESKHQDGSIFHVSVSANRVAELKKAIKKELPNDLANYDARRLTIYENSGAGWKMMTDENTALKCTTWATAYGFTV